MVFPVVAGVLAARGPFLFFFLGSMLLISIGIAFVRYWRYRYRFMEHELVVERGWVYRSVRHIAYVRVQNVNITRNPLHRLFGVSGMQLESASGSEPEAVMDAISQAEIDELHDRVERAKGERPLRGPAAEGERAAAERETGAEVKPETAGEVREAGELQKPGREPRREILRIGVGELVRHGIISNRGMVLVAALFGFLFQGQMAERYLPKVLGWLERFTDQPPAEMMEALGPVGWFFSGVALFLGVMLILGLLSVTYAIIRFYNFTLSVDSKNVRAEYGLFTRVAITIPKHRIQLIGCRANPFHRLFRRLSLRVETAGISGGEEDLSTLRWLAPILPEAELVRVLKEVQPEVDWGAFEWRPLHPRTRVRMLRIRLVTLALATALLAWTMGLAGLVAIAAIPLVLLYARGYFRYAGWAVTPTAIAFRSGWVVKSQSVVRYPKIQIVALTQNPFDRRWGMTTVTADTAGGDPAGHRVQIRFMDRASAVELRDLLEDRTRTTAFVW